MSVKSAAAFCPSTIYGTKKSFLKVLTVFVVVRPCCFIYKFSFHAPQYRVDLWCGLRFHLPVLKINLIYDYPLKDPTLPENTPSLWLRAVRLLLCGPARRSRLCVGGVSRSCVVAQFLHVFSHDVEGDGDEALGLDACHCNTPITWRTVIFYHLIEKNPKNDVSAHYHLWSRLICRNVIQHKSCFNLNM